MLAKKILTNNNEEIVSTDDNLKTSSVDLVLNNSKRDRKKKITPTEVGQKI